jgi:hypothetical protein
MKTLFYILIALLLVVVSVLLSFANSEFQVNNISATLTSDKTIDEGLPTLIHDDSRELITEVLTRACQILINASVTFDISEFSSVFANDPRFPVYLSDYPLLVKYFPDPSAETGGYLDYLVAYYTWRKEGTLLFESIQKSMASENRTSMTNDEISSLQEIGIPPARLRLEDWSVDTLNCVPNILSLDVKGDLAVVVISEGATTSKQHIVKKGEQWYIVDRNVIIFAP